MNYNDNITTSVSQNALIREYLEAGNTITSLEALNLFGCMRLASRICDLREQGVPIATERIQVPSGKYVTRYSLAQ